GKPVLSGGAHSSIKDAASYALWYRDTDPAGEVDMWRVQDSLVLGRSAGADSGVYQFDSSSHFPLSGRGHGNTCGNEPVDNTCCGTNGSCLNKNYHFTTELRYFFQYQGGETLSFRGDDDVWVFVNGRLAVDIGGVHSARHGRVDLGD